MTFILSSEMINDILFAMENQSEMLSFDALEGICVDMDEIDDEYETVIDDQRYYDIPEWTSAHGFHIMEQFTARVHNPLLREALLAALGQRKGVFRRYKETLKTAPAVEREWYHFKEQHMKATVYEWYNDLRKLWGLEKISFEEETDAQLLLEDFTFRIEQCDTLKRESVRNFIHITETPVDDGSPCGNIPDGGKNSGGEPLNNDTVHSFTQKAAYAAGRLFGHTLFFDADMYGAVQQAHGTAHDHAAYIAAYNGNELCGLCSVAAFPFTECLCIPFLRVAPEYRGLGLGKALLQRACAYAKPLADVLLFADFCAPPHLIALLEREGFARSGLLYVKALSESDAE